jgi:hypothetical protein
MNDENETRRDASTEITNERVGKKVMKGVVKASLIVTMIGVVFTILHVVALLILKNKD